MQLSEKLTEKYIAALDVGTTTIRCQIINSKAERVSEASTAVKLVYPQNGFVEIEPETLFEDVTYVIKEAIKKASLQVENISSLAIGTQRATFMTWRKDNGNPFHNFITWKDLRSKLIVKEKNESLIMKSLRAITYCLYVVGRNPRYLAASKLFFTSTHVNLKLLWVLKNIPEIKNEIKVDNVMFGTIDTWLVYKFTGGKTYVTDFTNASSTGLFDPFVLSWSTVITSIAELPIQILPPIVNNDYDFGNTESNIFGKSLPIKCVMADQQASMFGSFCFTDEILKVTLGTGSFLDIQTPELYTSTDGAYPLVFTSFKEGLTYMVEGACNDCGSLIEWAINIGLVENASKTSEIANSVDDTDGIYFIPAFSGLGPPICDDKAASGFFGVKPTSKKAHMVRAILESIVFRVVLLYQILMRDVDAELKRIYVDGGVSKNDFICQMIADMTYLPVERSTSSEMSVMGLAFVAGLNSGIWKDKDHIKSLRKLDKIFVPTMDWTLRKQYIHQLQNWRKTVDRFGAWYS